MKMPIKDDPRLQKKLAAARETLAYQLEHAIGTFGDELWEAMQNRGIPQAELARRARVSRQFLTKVFRGDNNFTLETMVKLANVVGCRLYLHLAPADLHCEWQHFFKEKLQPVSAHAREWEKHSAQVLKRSQAADHEDLALAA
jgi:transcriptional regulator with XRE-family HTH domain